MICHCRFLAIVIVKSLTKVLSEVAPTVLKLAENAAKHPAVAEYLASDGHLAYTGMNKVW